MIADKSKVPAELAKKAGEYGRPESRFWEGWRLHRSLAAAQEVASWAVFVDAIDEVAASFYRKYGFLELPEEGLKLFLPMKTIAKALG